MTTAVTHVSKAQLVRAHERLQSLQNRIAKFKDHAAKTTEKVVRTVEVGVAALGVGVLQGRSGSIEIMGVPAELGLGLGLNLLGYFGAAGKHSDHLNNFGDGALAAYLVTVGKGVGTAMKAKSGQAAVTKGAHLTPAEIAAAAAHG
jgi:hypothetical protein